MLLTQMVIDDNGPTQMEQPTGTQIIMAKVLFRDNGQVRLKVFMVIPTVIYTHSTVNSGNLCN